MTKFTVKEELENVTYIKLDADSINESAELLDSLSEQDQMHYAHQIVQSCPSEDFKEYKTSVHHLQGSFATVLNQHCVARTQIESILDPKSKSPHLQWIKGDFFNPANFTNKAFVHEFFTSPSENLNRITRLIKSTPEAQRDEVVGNFGTALHLDMDNLHPFPALLRRAFDFAHQLDKLRREDINSAIESLETIVQDHKDFPGLAAAYLENHVQSITEKLAQAEDGFHARISTALNHLTSEQSCVFKTILDDFKQKIQPRPAPSKESQSELPKPSPKVVNPGKAGCCAFNDRNSASAQKRTTEETASKQQSSHCRIWPFG